MLLASDSLTLRIGSSIASDRVLGRYTDDEEPATRCCCVAQREYSGDRHAIRIQDSFDRYVGLLALAP
jgi:hypothetical protein